MDPTEQAPGAQAAEQPPRPPWFSGPLLALALWAVQAQDAAAAIRFRDVAESSGIRFVHTDGSSGGYFVVESVASGLGLIDADGDGHLDILFLNGGPLPGSPQPAVRPTNQLYRNRGDATFTDITAGSGLDFDGYAMGCAVADYDNDGDEDVFITAYGPHRLFRNEGNGRFRDVTSSAGLEAASLPNGVGAGCAFLDYDRDGWIDLFVGNYLICDPAEHEVMTFKNHAVYANPRAYPSVPNRLFRNRGDGTFQDVSTPSGVGQHLGYAMGVCCADLDGDGWTEIYVGNDGMENFLFHNQRDGTFREWGIRSGAAYDQFGDPQGTMGTNVGDYDGDGLPDLIVTAYQDQVSTLYRNLGGLQFTDVTVRTGAGAGSRPLVTWGCGLVDFDNDGTRELFTAAGHLQDNVEDYDRSSTYHQQSKLLKQQAGRFVDVTETAGDLATVRGIGRGAVFGDLNQDGKLDIVVQNARQRPNVYLNDTPETGHWVMLKLTGTRSNRSAIGAKVRLTAGGRTQIGEVLAGRGYQSAEDLRLHFGLGLVSAIDRIEVAWPSGQTNVWTHLAAERVLQLTEGGGEATAAAPD